MMPDQSDAAPARTRVGPLHDVDARAVVLNEIQIGRRELFQAVTEIAHHRNRLQEYFRKDHGGSDVDVDPAVVQPGNEAAKQAEIIMAGSAQRRRP